MLYTYIRCMLMYKYCHIGVYKVGDENFTYKNGKNREYTF